MPLSSREDNINDTVSSSNSVQPKSQVSKNRTEKVELSAGGDVSLASWNVLKRDAGYYSESGKYRGGLYKKARGSYHEEFRCIHKRRDCCQSWETTHSSGDRDPTACRCDSERGSPVCESWHCSRDDRDCVCETRSEKDRYCLKWSCVQKSNGEIDTEEYYECAADDASGEYCRVWQANISSSYQISSAVCRCTEAEKNYCTRWACDERWLVRCASHFGGWCDMNIALGVGCVLGGCGLIIIGTILYNCSIGSCDCDKIKIVALIVVGGFLFCSLLLFGVVIWGGVKGFVFVSVTCIGFCFLVYCSATVAIHGLWL